MEDYVLSEEDEIRVREGEAAASLLDSPIFLLAIERVRQQCADQILASPPDKQASREQLYNLSRGLSAVTEELLAIANLGTTTLDNATRPTDDNEVQAEPDNDVDF